jgi:hypothetical protein
MKKEKMKSQRLTHQELKEALLRLQELAKLKLLKYSPTEQEKITDWLTTYTSQLNLSTFTRHDARERLLDYLETDPVRNYVLELAVAFFTYGGDSDDFEEKLVNSLVAGLCLEGRNPNWCELPPEVLISAPSENFPLTRQHPLVLRVLRTLRIWRDEVSLKEYMLSNRHMQLVALLAFVDDLVDTPHST